MPLHLQETELVVGGVSEYERGLSIISNRKKEEEARKKAKAAPKAKIAKDRDNSVVEIVLVNLRKRERGSGAGRARRRSLEPAGRNRKISIRKRCNQVDF